MAFDRPWYRVRQDKVQVESGKIIKDYFLGIFPNIVLIVAFTKEKEILFVRQYKHGAGKILLEVPAGYLDRRESPIRAAKRELIEETGYRASQWKKLGFFYSNPTKEKGNGLYIFLAQNAERVRRQKLDTTEKIKVYRIKKKEVLRKIRGNKIQVAGSIAALLLAFDELKNPRH